MGFSAGDRGPEQTHLRDQVQGPGHERLPESEPDQVRGTSENR